ncbi:MAG: hypothetical protein P0Y53_16265 [Candidatus Pseudobacter hemicellulosilyticus]|uniref:Uncharacterized protein n=1 Tax=Candidatus Pseudobacter hemicellulosilyticus TaxID=3121375 RepID=A0AAJ6BF97_9BACT|nr:MAG: hypothetical protein P0Y53_16265 [Pseudobacter sp.]
MNKIGNKINKDIILPIAVGSLSSLIYARIGDNNFTFQIIFIVAAFFIHAILHFFIGKSKAAVTADSDKEHKQFDFRILLEGLRKAAALMILTFSLLFVIYYDSKHDYHTIPLLITRTLYLFMVWFISLVIGSLFVAVLFFTLGIRLLRVSEELVPNGESKNGTLNYFLLLLSVATFTYFFDNNFLYATALIATIFTYWFLFFIFVGFIISFDKKDPSQKEYRTLATSGLIAFSCISTILYLINHPVMIKIMTNLEKPISYISQLFTQ